MQITEYKFFNDRLSCKRRPGKDIILKAGRFGRVNKKRKHLARHMR
jgi:hypothetical protein